MAMDLKTQMLKALQDINDGNHVVLETLAPNNQGIPIKWIAFSEEEGLTLNEIRCTNSKKLGLGDCPCRFHPPTLCSRIDEQQAIQLLVGLLENNEERRTSLRKIQAKLSLRRLNDIITNM